jgi:hypothetical protein
MPLLLWQELQGSAVRCIPLRPASSSGSLSSKTGRQAVPERGGSLRVPAAGRRRASRAHPHEEGVNVARHARRRDGCARMPAGIRVAKTVRRRIYSEPSVARCATAP